MQEPTQLAWSLPLPRLIAAEMPGRKVTIMTLGAAAEFMTNELRLASTDGEALGVIGQLVRAAATADRSDLDQFTDALEHLLATRGMRTNLSA